MVPRVKLAYDKAGTIPSCHVIDRSHPCRKSTISSILNGATSLLSGATSASAACPTTRARTRRIGAGMARTTGFSRKRKTTK